jgi:hypothetical protein
LGAQHRNWLGSFVLATHIAEIIADQSRLSASVPAFTVTKLQTKSEQPVPGWPLRHWLGNTFASQDQAMDPSFPRGPFLVAESPDVKELPPSVAQRQQFLPIVERSRQG